MPAGRLGRGEGCAAAIRMSSHERRRARAPLSRARTRPSPRFLPRPGAVVHVKRLQLRHADDAVEFRHRRLVRALRRERVAGGEDMARVEADADAFGRVHAVEHAGEMLEAAGLKNVTPWDIGSAPGLCIHEMGTTRMGHDPKTSVLNGWNQVHTAMNVFVTDGACMTSASCVNPSLTYMALTARACDHAVSEINKRNL